MSSKLIAMLWFRIVVLTIFAGVMVTQDLLWLAAFAGVLLILTGFQLRTQYRTEARLNSRK